MALLLNLSGRDPLAPTDLDAVGCGEEGPVLLLPGDASCDDAALELTEVETNLIDYPDYKDGRGFTLGTRQRAQHGFEGEIRAEGKFIPDQTPFLQRCGFDSALFAEPARYEAGKAALARVNVVMQAAPACPKPSVLHLRHGRGLKASA